MAGNLSSEKKRVELSRGTHCTIAFIIHRSYPRPSGRSIGKLGQFLLSSGVARPMYGQNTKYIASGDEEKITEQRPQQPPADHYHQGRSQS